MSEKEKPSNIPVSKPETPAPSQGGDTSKGNNLPTFQNPPPPPPSKGT